MKRQITAFLMLMIFTSTSLSSAWAEVKEFSCDGGTYSVEMPSGTLTRDNGCKGSLVIDSSVKTIGDRAFKSSKVTSIVIPDSVTKIGYGAFYSSQIASIVIPNSVTKIEPETFESSNISSIIIPDSVTEIGDRAFNFTLGLKSIKLGKSVTSIGNQAFSWTGLSGIIFPESLKSIGNSAFWMGKYVYLDIPNSVTLIGSNAFAGMKNLKSIFYCGPANSAKFPISPTCPVDRKAAVAALEAKIASDAKVASDAAKLAADKAEAAAAAEIARQDAKKLTITCEKGKVKKKITGETPKCPSGYRNTLDAYLTFKAFSICKLYKKDSYLGGVTLTDGGKTLTFSGVGKYASLVSAGNFADLICALTVLKTPSFVKTQIDTTRALDGMQKATWGKISALWTYHPDNGMNISFNSK